MIWAGVNKVVVEFGWESGDWDVDYGVTNYPCEGVVVASGRIVRGKEFDGYTEFNRLNFFSWSNLDPVNPGERILYDFTAHYEPVIFDENMMVLSMDLIVGVHRGVWVGLNNNILFEKIDDIYGVTPDGRRLIYERAVRLQLDVYNTLTDKPQSLHKAKSRHVHFL